MAAKKRSKLATGDVVANMVEASPHTLRLGPTSKFKKFFEDHTPIEIFFSNPTRDTKDIHKQYEVCINGKTVLIDTAEGPGLNIKLKGKGFPCNTPKEFNSLFKTLSAVANWNIAINDHKPLIVSHMVTRAPGGEVCCWERTVLANSKHMLLVSIDGKSTRNIDKDLQRSIASGMCYEVCGIVPVFKEQVYCNRGLRAEQVGL